MKKLLFVCTVNRMRSATAERIYQGDARFLVASAGTDRKAATVLDEELLEWADVVVVMEARHRNHIRRYYPDVFATKKIVCLYLPDEYYYMQPELIDVLQQKIEQLYADGLL